MSSVSLLMVAALREVAVLFAAIIGPIALRKPFGRYRIAVSTKVAAGVMILHAAG